MPRRMEPAALGIGLFDLFHLVAAEELDPLGLGVAVGMLEFFALRFEGADRVEVGADGDLLLTLGESVVRQPKPVIYQETAGVRREVEGGYVVEEGGRVRFAVGEYDPRLPLVIDPTIVYSTYLGGAAADQAWAVAVDSSGSAYVAGYTVSTNFPTANAIQAANAGSQDAFVAKLNPAGTALVYSTYIGGSGKNKPYRHLRRRRGRPVNDEKSIIAGAVERGGNVVARVVQNTSADVLTKFLREAVSADTFIPLLNDSDAQIRMAALLAISEMPASDAAAGPIVAMLQKSENGDDRWIP